MSQDEYNDNKFVFDTFEDAFTFLTEDFGLEYVQAARILASAVVTREATWYDSPDFPVRRVVANHRVSGTFTIWL